MLPMAFVRKQLGELLAADTSTLAPATANKIALVVNQVTPQENLTVADLSFATFAGGAPKSGVAGAQQVGIDPITGEQVITILSPAGGWRWECTAAPAVPEQIFGFALVDDTLADLWAYALLPQAVNISSVGQFIDLGSVPLTFVLTPIS